MKTKNILYILCLAGLTTGSVAFYQLQSISHLKKNLQQERASVDAKKNNILKLEKEIHDLKNNRLFLLSELEETIKNRKIYTSKKIIANLKKHNPDFDLRKESKELFDKLEKLIASKKTAQLIAKIKSSENGLLINSVYPSLTNLPENYEGSDVRALYDVLSGIPEEKGEYETREEFDKKVETTIAENDELKKILNSYIVLTNKAWLDTSYDPKQKAFYFRYPLKDRLAVKSDSYGGYIGENAFGVKREVSRTNDTYYDVTFMNKDIIRSHKRKEEYEKNEWCIDCAKVINESSLIREEYGYSSQEYKDFRNSAKEQFCEKKSYLALSENSKECVALFKPETNDPKDFAKALMFAYVVKLIPPYISSYTGYNEPTIDNPISLRWNGKKIYTNLLGIAVFNNDTGEVFFHRKIE